MDNLQTIRTFTNLLKQISNVSIALLQKKHKKITCQIIPFNTAHIAFKSHK